MTRLVTITKSGPKFNEPRSLETLLADSVSFEREKWLQANCVSSDTLPSEYACEITHLELEKFLTNG